MTQYLISFDDGAMAFPEEELPDVTTAALKVAQEAQDALPQPTIGDGAGLRGLAHPQEHAQSACLCVSVSV